MSNYPGIMIFFDIRPALSRLSLEQKGQLFDALMEYGENGTVVELDGMTALAFDFMRPRIDRDREKYSATVLQRRYAVFCREEKRNNREPIEFDEWYRLISADGFRSSDDTPRYPTTTITTTTTPATTTKESGTDKPSTPTRKKYGEYGWVKLEEAEYSRLLADLGETELSRCIEYIDTSAQSTGNKNRWKDWNLVLRRCSREGWGRQRGTDAEIGPAPKAKRYEIIDGEAVEVNGDEQ